MKESIFFNKEQLKIISWYNVLYQYVFKYGSYLFALILSLVLFYLLILFNGAFSLSSEEIIVTSLGHKKAILETEKIKNQTFEKIPFLKSVYLNGILQFSSGVVISQDNLLFSDHFVLPRFVRINYETLSWYVEKTSWKIFDEHFLYEYFQTVLSDPLQKKYFHWKKTGLLPLKDSLKKSFWLNCIRNLTKQSFVCRHYINTFLDSFYFYQLDDYFEELSQIYFSLKNNIVYENKIIEGLLKYLNFGGTLDPKIAEIFSATSHGYYSSFKSFEDFYTIQQWLSQGFLDEKAYSSPLLNSYKLFSLQQLIYKQLNAFEDTKPLLSSYFRFLHKLLDREARGSVGLNSFAKNLTHWYNINILSPYLKDEKANLKKEDRVFLLNQLLKVHYESGEPKFYWLDSQVSYKKGKNEGVVDKNIVSQDLKSLFEKNTPARLNVLSLEFQKEENVLLVKWVDKETDVVLEASLKYENLSFYVSAIVIKDNEKLTEYLSAFVEAHRYRLVQLLWFISESLKLAQQDETVKFDLCKALKDKYHVAVLSCSNRSIKMSIIDKQDNKREYTFSLKNGKIANLNISDKVLESKILKDITFSNFPDSMTFELISMILNYSLKDDSSWFGMKNYLSAIEKFTQYFSQNPDDVVLNGGAVTVYFTVKDIKFIATYDAVTSKLSPIALDFWKKRRPVIIQNFVLTLRDDSIQDINAFLLDPLKMINSLNPRIIKKYFPKYGE